MDPTAQVSPRRLTETNVWACSKCNTHLAYNTDIVSKNFQGRHGRAFLFKEVINIRIGEPSTEGLMTGKHDISKVSCASCDDYLGWKYITAPDISQNYKVGLVLLEKSSIAKDGTWV